LQNVTIPVLPTPPFLPATEASLPEAGWLPAGSSAFGQLIGQVWHRVESSGLRRYGLFIRPEHDNTQRRAHGGLVMTLCDDAMGHTAVSSREGAPMFTVSFDCHFISGAAVGEFLEAHCEVVRATRSMMFMRSTCYVGDRVVATSSGIWKVLQTS
jgi:acyl-coenzyme A thioesterase PaaI-like protein